MVPDKTLQHDVLAQLEFEPSVNAAHIGVAAKDGVVTLTGHVSSFEQKLIAERAARGVHGVKAVAQEIEVRLPSDKKCGDDEIAERALKIINWDLHLPASSIYVKVDHGIVTLHGTVEEHFQRSEAKRSVRSASSPALSV
jgi:osmotically-inducible protein OsmY